MPLEDDAAGAASASFVDFHSHSSHKGPFDQPMVLLKQLAGVPEE